MTTATAETSVESTALAKIDPPREPALPPQLFTITEETIAAKRSAYLSLRINGIEDKEGYDKVHDALQEMVHSRTALEKERKQANELAQAHIRSVNGRAKELQAKMDPIETHLRVQRQNVDMELERRKKLVEDAMVSSRRHKLEQIGATLPEAVLRKMTDDEFELQVIHFEAEAQAKAEAEAKRKADEERLAAERAELERQRKEQDEKNRAEQARIAAERRKQDEELAKQRAADAARLKAEEDRLAKIEADRKAAAEAERRQHEAEAQAERDRLAAIERNQQAERDRIAAEEKRLRDERDQALIQSRRLKLREAGVNGGPIPDIALRTWTEEEFSERIEDMVEAQRAFEEQVRRDAEAEAERKKQAELEQERLDHLARERAEALRPDREKLFLVANALMAINIPDVSDAARGARLQIVRALNDAVEEVRQIAATVV